MPVGIRFIYNDQESDVDIYFYKLFNSHLDLDEFIRLFLTTKNNRQEVTLDSIKYNMIFLFQSKRIIRDMCKYSKVKKITILLKENYENVYLFFSYWMAVSQLSKFLHEHFQTVENEYYMTSNLQTEISFECIIEVRGFKLLFIFLKNIKELLRIKRHMKKRSK